VTPLVYSKTDLNNKKDIQYPGLIAKLHSTMKSKRVSFLSVIPLLQYVAALPLTKIQVCRNKHCSKQGSHDVLEYFPILTDASSSSPPQKIGLFEIEATGCISECGKGPNLRVVVKDEENKSTIFTGVKDADDCAEVLTSFCNFSVPPLLIAACNIIKRSDQSTSNDDKEKMLNSVIYALEKDKTEDKYLKALSLCYAKRADARTASTPQNLVGALNDSRQAVALDPENGMVWRILAEVEELSGNLDQAMIALSKRAQVEPAFRAKSENEIQRIRNSSRLP